MRLVNCLSCITRFQGLPLFRLHCHQFLQKVTKKNLRCVCWHFDILTPVHVKKYREMFSYLFGSHMPNIRHMWAKIKTAQHWHRLMVMPPESVISFGNSTFQWNLDLETAKLHKNHFSIFSSYCFISVLAKKSKREISRDFSAFCRFQQNRKCRLFSAFSVRPPWLTAVKNDAKWNARLAWTFLPHFSTLFTT